MYKILISKKTLILLCFILIKFIFQYSLINDAYDLQRDEYLHLDQANHLAWGYQSVPPFTSWISYIIQLLGNDIFWIKFFPALFGALTIFIVWQTIDTLGGNLFAQILGATCVLFSALLRLNTLFQPNSFDVLCWTALYFILIKFIKTEKSSYLFIGAIIFALGFLNKYNIIFLLIGFIPALLLSEHRKIFIQVKFYWAIFLGLIIIAPNLIWQYNRDFPVIHHLKELAETQLVNVDRAVFLKSQILFFLGALFVILASFYALLFYTPFKKYKVFFFSFVFTMLTFLFLKAKDYYTIGMYPVYISFGSVFLAHFTQKGWRSYLQPLAIAIPVLFFIPIYKIAFPNKSPAYIAQHPKLYQDFGLLRWEDGKDHLLPQDFADMLGWKELALKVDKAYANMPNKDMTLVLCDNYGQAGAINFYTTQKIKAVSYNADYINWFNLTKQYVHLIRVKEASNSDDEMNETAPFFQHSIIADSISNKYAREFGTTIFVFTGAKININKRIKQEINEKNNKTSAN